MKIHSEVFIISIFNATSFMNRILSTLAWVILQVGLSFGQDVAPAASVPPPPTPSVSPAAPKEETKLPVRERERTVYVPYEELEKTFQDGGRGVFLPYREFLELWGELTLKREREEKAPTDGVVSRAEYTGRVEDGTLTLDAKITVESFQKSWVSLPLGAADMAGIGEAVTGKAVLQSGTEGVKVLLPEKGVYELSLKLFAPVTQVNGKSRVKLSLPRAAVSKLTAAIPGEALEFEVTPAAAFTSRAGAAGQTELSFFFGAGASHEVSWGAPQGATQLTPLILADTKLTSSIGAGSIATNAEIKYRLMRAPLAAFRIGIPKGQEVLGVTGDDIKEWNIEASGESQTLVVTPNKPVKDNYALTLALEAAIPKLPAEVSVPGLVIEGASYARGTASVQTESQFDATAKGLENVARANASGSTPQGLIAVGSFRLLKQPYKLSLDVTEAKPQIEVSSLTKLDVQRDAVKIDTEFDFNVRRVGIFEIKITLPANLSLTTVTGDGIAEWSAVTTPPATQTLTVKMNQQKTGLFKIKLGARQMRTQPTEDLSIPTFTITDAGRHEAKVGVSIHSSLEANTKDIGGFQQEDVSALGAMMSKGGNSAATLAFRYRDAAKPAALGFKSRDPQVSVEVLTLVEAKEQSTRHQWTLAFDVAYAAVDRFVLALPKAVANEIRLIDPQVKETNKTYKPDPAKIKGADTTDLTYWEVVLRSEKTGAFQLSLSHEKQGALEAGKTGKVELLQLHVPGAFQETGQVAVIKDDSLEIRSSQPENLEEIDSRELHPSIQRPGVFLAFKYRTLPLKLAVEIAKNDYFKVPQAVVTHADLTTAVATDRAQSTEVIYWVKNIDLQFLVVTLPVGAKLQSDIIVGRETQQPMRREGSEDLLVRLPSGSGSSREAFPVRFVYEVPSAKPGEKLGTTGNFAVEPPSVGEVKVFETRHRLYLPEAWHYTQFDGPLMQNLADRGWMRIRRIVDPLIPALGPQASRANDFKWNDPPAVAAEVKSLFDFQVPNQGHLETLRRLGPPAKITASFRSKKLTFAFEAIAFLLTALLGVSLSRRALIKKLFFVVILGCGAVLATGLLTQANAAIANAVILAVGLVIGLWLLLGFLSLFKRKEPAAPAPPSPAASLILTPPPVPLVATPPPLQTTPVVVPKPTPVSSDDLEFPEVDSGDKKAGE